MPLLWSLLRQRRAAWSAALLGRQGSVERLQASLFVDVEPARRRARLLARRGPVARPARPAGPLPGRRAGRGGVRRHARAGPAPAPDAPADADLVELAERQLARAIGAASARVMIGSVVRGEVDRARRSDGDPRRDLAGASSTAGGSSRSRRRSSTATAELRARQRAPAAARPAQGRLHRHGQPRAAHAADLDPLVLRDPARHARSRRRPSGAQFLGSSCANPSG